MAEAGPLPPLETAAAAREKVKLRKVLGRFDLVLFTACAILGFDTELACLGRRPAEAAPSCGRTWLLIFARCSCSRTQCRRSSLPLWPRMMADELGAAGVGDGQRRDRVAGLA